MERHFNLTVQPAADENQFFHKHKSQQGPLQPAVQACEPIVNHAALKLKPLFPGSCMPRMQSCHATHCGKPCGLPSFPESSAFDQAQLKNALSQYTRKHLPSAGMMSVTNGKPSSIFKTAETPARQTLLICWSGRWPRPPTSSSPKTTSLPE